MKKIPYDEDKIRWHLNANFYPNYSESIVEAMLKTIKDYNSGKIKLNDPINSSTTMTVGELLEDLKLL